MTTASRHDAWSAGDAYDSYMGRWSRRVAPRFLDWLQVPADADWLDIGCGTGALSEAILAGCSPRSLRGVDPSEGFVATARAKVRDGRASFEVGDAQKLVLETDSRDAVVSALAVNFIPDKSAALAEMQRVARPGGTIGFYVWDYAGGGLQFLRAFWQVAAQLDPAAADLAENRRFSFCNAPALSAMAMEAGLGSVACVGIEIDTAFRDFEDYWRPFTLGAGPAPGYCKSLPAERREELREHLRQHLVSGDGSIALKARAWAVKGVAA